MERIPAEFQPVATICTAAEIEKRQIDAMADHRAAVAREIEMDREIDRADAAATAATLTACRANTLAAVYDCPDRVALAAAYDLCATIITARGALHAAADRQARARAAALTATGVAGRRAANAAYGAAIAEYERAFVAFSAADAEDF